MRSQDVINSLSLEPHIEGGYFRRSYSSPLRVPTPVGERDSLSCIYYLLTHDSSVGHWHQNRSDIVHFYQGGKPIRYYLIAPDGKLHLHVLGSDLLAGEQLQLCVPGGYWKASELIIDSRQSSDHNWGLISEAVSPGFDYDDMRLASQTRMQELYPQHFEQIKHLIKPDA